MDFTSEPAARNRIGEGNTTHLTREREDRRAEGMQITVVPLHLPI